MCSLDSGVAGLSLPLSGDQGDPQLAWEMDDVRDVKLAFWSEWQRQHCTMCRTELNSS